MGAIWVAKKMFMGKELGCIGKVMPGVESLGWSDKRLKRLLCLLLGLTAGCAVHQAPHSGRDAPWSVHSPSQRPYEIFGVYYYPIPAAEGYVEEGVASWYGRDFHGKPTSSGEIYDMQAMTAAHKTLPLGTHVKVVCLETGKNIVVRINDRGPFVKGRIIDLSRFAAQELGFLEQGIARVRVEAVRVAEVHHENGRTGYEVERTPDFRQGAFAIQVGAFQTLDSARHAHQAAEKLHETVRIISADARHSAYYRVQVGRFSDLIEAHLTAAHLADQGFADAMVVAIED
jgi:rare lipoprotein A